MRTTLLIALLFIATVATAQNGPAAGEKAITASGAKTDISKADVYNYVEQMPVAGYDYHKYIFENFHYPERGSDGGDGRVVLKFIVNENGRISDVTLVRGLNEYLNQEAERVVKNMPPWKPGRQNGKAVKVWFTLPITIDAE